ncbi:hypothetical protein FisN_29Lh004 [Fistulifera solaris]|uniref:Transmembrane protein n=1 Tax=Fistulifera solaris TaxID=1519565 RepID=A0A1Z5JLA7_FISSO|nr:hypothetical protein FisN_29Lh004 [Fistulifera solaris]|eukprot:GAX14805.1 hypothetical protein FisN_29Lh004 [Fistulifera solaris]
MFVHTRRLSFVFPVLVHSLNFGSKVHGLRTFSSFTRATIRPSYSRATIDLKAPRKTKRTSLTMLSTSSMSQLTNSFTSSLPAFHTLLVNESGDSSLSVTRIAATLAIPAVLILFTMAYLYRGAILEKLRQLEEDSLFLNVQMTRVSDPSEQEGSVFRHLQLLEIDRETCQKLKEQEGWQLMSLGEYMRQLKPAMLPASIQMKDVPTVLQAELGAALTAALLKALGPNLGRAVLPLTGRLTQGPTKALASALAGRALAMQTTSATVSDRAGLPLNLMSVLAVSEVNAKVQELWKSPESLIDDSEMESTQQQEQSTVKRTTPMEKMIMGETGNDPSFASNEFIPSKRFHLDTDLPAALDRMEAILMERANTDEQVGEDKVESQSNRRYDIGGVAPSINSIGGYKPEGRAMAPPVPINPRLLPDLHLGWGNAQCTQTNREVLLNRLVAVLMNKLASNYYRRYTGQSRDGDFTVVYNGKEISTPSGFIEALIETGHHVETAVTTHVTTFGIALCVKEKDGSFSNIPLACFLDSGYEDREGNAASVAMPHSGLDLDISGPLFGDRGDGKPAKLSIQHFIAIDGFCGWYTNHNANVPWIRGIDCGPRLKGAEAVRAARYAAVYATCLNGLATERDLPFGGYGLTAVCNDSAAVIEECLHGTCSIYPMTSIGSYMMRTVRYAAGVRETFQSMNTMEQEVDALGKIIQAMGKIPSDLNALPSYAADSAKRILHGLPENPSFQLMTESRAVMVSLLKEKAMDEVAAQLPIRSRGIRVTQHD